MTTSFIAGKVCQNESNKGHHCLLNFQHQHLGFPIQVHQSKQINQLIKTSAPHHTRVL